MATSGPTTNAGNKLYISAAKPTTFDGTGYAALTWTEIGEITDPGDKGRTYAPVNHMPVASRTVQKFKGSRDDGNMNVAYATDRSDAGQILCKTALDSDNDYSFKSLYQNGEIDYFQAKVMSMAGGAGGTDSMRSGTMTLAITATKAGTGIVEVAAP
ncbi:MAG: hypothetical protein EON92_06240 [Burkholderiales bacterium]|nr:MAG: hypothetical protein EON92_06240 [Burkholderiales bacterium]